MDTTTAATSGALVLPSGQPPQARPPAPEPEQQHPLPQVGKDAPVGAKKHWTPTEDTELLSLVDEEGPRNWAQLAARLGTGRTGPSCCARWCRLAGPKQGGSNVADDPLEPTLASNEVAYQAISKGPRQKWAKWQPSEDAELAALVAQHGPKNWGFISSHMSTERSDDSCCGRWTHYLAPKTEVDIQTGEVKGIPKANSNASNPRWTAEEDAQLSRLKATDPTMSWGMLADRMEPKRTPGSCRARWVQKISKPIKSATGEGEPFAAQRKASKPSKGKGKEKDPLPEPDMDVLPSTPIPSQSQPPDLEVPRLPPPASLPDFFSIPTSGPSTATGSGEGMMLDPALMELNLPALDAEGEDGGQGKGREMVPFKGALKAGGRKRGTKRGTDWVDSKGNKKSKVQPAPITPIDPLVISAVLNPFAATAAPHSPSAAAASPSERFEKKVWTDEEDAHLVQLVEEGGTKGWARIADQLGTGRSAASVSARYQRCLVLKRMAERKEKRGEERGEGERVVEGDIPVEEAAPVVPAPAAAPIPEASLASDSDAPKKGRKGPWRSWSPADDAELKALVAVHGRNSWAIVGAAMKSPRSAFATSSRWYDHVAKSTSKDVIIAGPDGKGPSKAQFTRDIEEPSSAPKRRWKPSEDAELRALVMLHGPSRWTEIGKAMSSNRPGTSCRLRYINYISKLPEETIALAAANAAAAASAAATAPSGASGSSSSAVVSGPQPQLALGRGDDIQVGPPSALSGGSGEGEAPPPLTGDQLTDIVHAVLEGGSMALGKRSLDPMDTTAETSGSKRAMT